MNPLDWIKLAVEGAKLASDIYHGRADHAEAQERVHRIRKRGEENALLDKRLRAQLSDPQADIDTKREKPPKA